MAALISKLRTKFQNLRILQPNPEPFRHVISDWRFIVAFVVLLFLTYWVGERWVFRSGSMAGMDVLWRAHGKTPASYCRLVTVDAEEFKTYLSAPLDPKDPVHTKIYDPISLEKVLREIDQYHPAVIVIDIDTSPPRFAKVGLENFQSTLVWGRVSHENLGSPPQSRPEWAPGDVLGNRSPQPEFTGSPVFPQEADNIVRTFQNPVPTKPSSTALYWAALQAYCKTRKDALESCRALDMHQEPMTRAFVKDWDFITYTLSDLMASVEESEESKDRQQLGGIVLLGGSFDDIHPTLFGPKLGVELTAAAIETELRDPDPPSEICILLFHWILKTLLGIGIAWINTQLMPRWSLLVMLVSLGVVFFLSLLSTYSQFLQIEFLPFVIGIWIEQLWETSERAQRLALAGTGPDSGKSK